MKKLIRILLVLVILLVVVGVASIFFIGAIVKAGVEKVGPIVAKVPVKLDNAKISLLGGSGQLKGFVIGNPDGFKSAQAIKVGTVSLSLVPSSVLKDKVVIHQIKVESPEITYETDLKGSNLQKILENVQGSAKQDEKAPTKKEQTTKTKLQVDDFVITGAQVTVAASMLGGQGATIPLPEIHLTNLGTGADGITPAELSQKVLSAVLDATVKAVTENVTKLGKGATDAAGAAATSAIDKLKKSTDLFKTKK
jgi:uncharacterized protein involved in outer membrane biogenesis